MLSPEDCRAASAQVKSLSAVHQDLQNCVCNKSQAAAALQDIAMNGCAEVTEDVWQHVNATSNQPVAVGAVPPPLPRPQHALQSLSLVGCKALRSCLLGLQPAAGWDALTPMQPCGDWLAAACHLSGLSLSNCTSCVP